MKVLIIIDMQNDFINGVLGTKEAQNILPNVIKRIQESKNELILFTFDTHDENYLDSSEGKNLPIIHCVKDTEGWLFEPNIINAWQNIKSTIRLKEIKDHYFEKPVFGSVELVEYLVSRKDEISEVELIGVCTDICVISNALMIKNTLPEIPVVVDGTLCAGVNPESHDKALDVMQMCHIKVKR